MDHLWTWGQRSPRHPESSGTLGARKEELTDASSPLLSSLVESQLCCLQKSRCRSSKPP